MMVARRSAYPCFLKKKLWTCVLFILSKIYKCDTTVLIKAVYEMIDKRAITPVRWGYRCIFTVYRM